SFSRLVLFDKRGTGMSDRLTTLPTLEARMDDVRAVMDAADSDRAVLFGAGDGGMVSALFAATYPERTSALVLFNSQPRHSRSPDALWRNPGAGLEETIEHWRRIWGDLDAMVEGLRGMIPSATEEELRQLMRIDRTSHSPETVAAYMRARLDVDV